MTGVSARPAREFTIHSAAWVAARARINGPEMDPDASAAFGAAMDHVDEAWTVLRDLFAWADRQPDEARRQIDTGPLLDLVQGELSEEFAGLARTLAKVTLDWPGWQQAGPENLGGYLDAFARYWTLLRLAVEVGKVSPPFRDLVRRTGAVLDPQGESSWCAYMGRLVESITALEPASPYRDGSWARRALGIVLYDMPAEQVHHARVFLLQAIEAIYVNAGHAPPQWVRLLRDEAEPAATTF